MITAFAETDEMDDVSRLSGMPDIERKCISDANSQKKAARRYASEEGMDYNGINLIVAHLGEGISVGAHKRGRMIDVNNAVDGEGPFSTETSGSLPVSSLIKLCFSGKYTQDEMLQKINGCGGLTAHLGTGGLSEVLKMIEDGDSRAELVFRSMAYQIAKEIGRCSASLSGDVYSIILTGYLAQSSLLVKWIEERVKFIAKVVVYPEADDNQAMAVENPRVIER